jgi:hypothetical protein
LNEAVVKSGTAVSACIARGFEYLKVDARCSKFCSAESGTPRGVSRRYLDMTRLREQETTIETSNQTKEANTPAAA